MGKRKIKQLKTLNINDLYVNREPKDSCVPYINTLEKAEIVRNAFFTVKASVLNFINDCIDLEEKIKNKAINISLEEVENKYLSILNIMSSSICLALTKENNDGLVINVNLIGLDDIDDADPLPSTQIEFRHPRTSYCRIITTLCYVPSITINVNPDNSETSIRFSEPTYVSTHEKAKGEDVNTVYTIANSSSNAFDSLESACRFLDDIINYEQFHAVITDLYHILKYLEKVIESAENAHRTVIQLAQVNGIVDLDCEVESEKECCEEKVHSPKSEKECHIEHVKSGSVKDCIEEYSNKSEKTEESVFIKKKKFNPLDRIDLELSESSEHEEVVASEVCEEDIALEQCHPISVEKSIESHSPTTLSCCCTDCRYDESDSYYSDDGFCHCDDSCRDSLHYIETPDSIKKCLKEHCHCDE